MFEDFTFSIMTNSQLEEMELVLALLHELSEAERVGGYIKYKNNIIKVEENLLHNENMAKAETDESWMYYKSSLIVFPEKDTTLDMQKCIAAELINSLHRMGEAAELVAEFEIKSA